MIINLNRNITGIELIGYIYTRTKQIPLPLTIVDSAKGVIDVVFNTTETNYHYNILRRKDNVILYSNSYKQSSTQQTTAQPLTVTPAKNAYQLALDGGYVGSQQEWLLSLMGVKGDKGDIGLKGDTGLKGDIGLRGENGTQGERGLDGQQGLPGYTPIKGTDYFDGEQGGQGVQGEQGLKGDDGYTPIKNVDYFDGEQGIQGIKGDTGNAGYTPIKGVDYFDGEQGVKGDTGEAGTTDYTQLSNKPDLSSLHGHSNSFVLSLIQEALTTALKADYDLAKSHADSVHAPTNAQKNSDISKVEIEAKLTGEISTHTHQGGSGGLNQQQIMRLI